MEGLPVYCPYCGHVAKLVGGKALYPHRPDLYSKNFYQCKPCSAYVGCHPGTTRPLGRLANAELRNAKMAAHAAFDPTWKSGKKKRREAYAWLAGRLGIDQDNCHIGEFDVTMCNKVINICNQTRLATYDVPKGFRVEFICGRHLLCGGIIPEEDIMIDQEWAAADGSDQIVTIVDNDDGIITFISAIQTQHEKDSFSFQTQYHLVLHNT